MSDEEEDKMEHGDDMKDDEDAGVASDMDEAPTEASTTADANESATSSEGEASVSEQTPEEKSGDEDEE